MNLTERKALVLSATIEVAESREKYRVESIIVEMVDPDGSAWFHTRHSHTTRNSGGHPYYAGSGHTRAQTLQDAKTHAINWWS
ncbi:hypothetical protein FHY55_04070 [Oceanicola sp. D3]|uniref:hypothetical protein n=1 Tax=Oceanicola sp. D3 TaxID=2587163 RepID=UPI0011215BB9|nr:hypothetical protein [Oceanicola sp. D3]QDC08471.1 hypothetical protein FHY55_04070 [Oceanicola sp. D3]